ncbi:hypothetical protein D3C72_1928130 [compost metagenome]
MRCASHSLSTSFSAITFGTLPSDSTFMLSGRRLSRSERRNSDSINSVASTVRLFGTSTMRTSSADSSLTSSSSGSLRASSSSAIFSISRDFCTWNGISVMTI